MTPETLALQRFVLDRALQPVEAFDGYDKLDQFREGAPRYQTCLSSYALSVSAYAHTPAFRGYVAEGQRRFGLKMQDHHVWGYWRVENLWGRLHQDPNPVAVNNNIMWTGWYAGMLGMLESASPCATRAARSTSTTTPACATTCTTTSPPPRSPCGRANRAGRTRCATTSARSG
jgi:hypothetical protein